MAVQGPFAVEFGALFPFGCGVVSEVTAASDFERSSRENQVQARDKATGLPVWQVDVMDFDQAARERTLRVKVICEHQPVPPDALPGIPVRPVVLENVSVTPYIKDGPRPKIAYSVRCTGLGQPVAVSAGKAAA